MTAFPATPSSGGALSAGQLGGYDAAKAWPPSPRPSPPPHHPHSSSAPTQRAVRANGLAEGAGTHVLCSLSLWRGLGPQYAKLAPIFLMTLPLYEQLRRLAGLGYLR